MLRKGPEHVPESWLILWFAIGLMVLSVFCASMLMPPSDGPGYLIVYTSIVGGLLIYVGVLLIAGFRRRLLQVMSAIIACGSILTLLYIVEYVLFSPFLGTRIAGIVATLILIWSVPVEGHIIARGIQQHWYAGIAIAMAVFILQIAFQQMMTSSS